MSMFRAKKLDLGCFVNTHIIRDHTKRKVYEQHEAERYVPFSSSRKHHSRDGLSLAARRADIFFLPKIGRLADSEI